MSDQLSKLIDISGSPYCFDARLGPDLERAARRVADLRSLGTLNPQSLKHLRQYFRLKSIYNSNAIEGNQLTVGETRLVLEEGMTITGKPLKDTVEVKNLSHALDFFEQLADRAGDPIREVDIRSVHAAILAGIDDASAGRYRLAPVEISGSAYRPPAPEEVTPKMQEFGSWLSQVTSGAYSTEHPVVLAAAAHAWFVMIHPFSDGNGRTARILMNLVLMRRDYPIAIITKDDRERYYDALEESQNSDLSGLIVLITECLDESLEEYDRAVQEQREHEEWAKSLVGVATAKDEAKARNEYEIWHSAMDLFKSYMRQTVDDLAGRDWKISIWFKDFGHLEYEKWLSLRRRMSAKHTWFFRVDFRAGDRAARYLFFFGYSGPQLRRHPGSSDVTLHIARETSPFQFSRVSEEPNRPVPTVQEVGYSTDSETFSVYSSAGEVVESRVEQISRGFIEEIVRAELT